jgi:hypothetical protein
VRKIIVVSYYKYIVLYPNHFTEITKQICLFLQNYNDNEKKLFIFVIHIH